MGRKLKSEDSFPDESNMQDNTQNNDNNYDSECCEWDIQSAPPQYGWTGGGSRLISNTDDTESKRCYVNPASTRPITNELVDTCTELEEMDCKGNRDCIFTRPILENTQITKNNNDYKWFNNILNNIPQCELIEGGYICF